MRFKYYFIILSVSFLLLNKLSYRTVWAQSPQTYNLRVLYVVLNPVENGQNLMEYFYPNLLNGRTADQYEDEWANHFIESFKQLSGNTINYQIVKKLQVTTFPKFTNGFVYNFEKYRACDQGQPACEQQKRLFDNVAFIQNNHICELAEQYQVDEIWHIGFHGLGRWEDYMIGPSPGYDVNGDWFIVPGCNKHYIVTSPNYTVMSYWFESYAHRIEANLRYLTQNWSPNDKQKYLEDFIALGRYGHDVPYDKISCGNAHYPHNAVTGYDDGNLTYQDSNCIDWRNFPNFTGATQNINCEAWGCTNWGWQTFWLGSLPRNSDWTELTDNNQQKIYLKKDWWFYLLYPENSLDFVNKKPFSPEGLQSSCSLSGNQVTLTWQTVPGATGYALRVNNLTDGWDGSCSSPGGDFCRELTQNSYTFIVNPEEEYSWWVHSINNYGWSTTGSSGPTFSCSPQGRAQFSFKIKFQGISSQKPNKVARVVLKQGTEERYRFDSVVMNADANGIYSGIMINITPGTYDVFIKGWAHLQKKFVGITISSGNNNQDWSASVLKAGDFNNDNVLNITDISSQLAKYTTLSSPVSPSNQIYDVNSNNLIDINDVSLVLANYTALDVTGD